MASVVNSPLGSEPVFVKFKLDETGLGSWFEFVNPDGLHGLSTGGDLKEV